MEQDARFENVGFTRRGFLKGAGLGAATFATLGFLGGCAPQAQGADDAQAGDGAGQADGGQRTGSVDQARVGEWSPETAPAAIAESDIVETVEADVVIVGAGCAGMSAALTAVQAGAKVAVVQNTTQAMTHGWSAGALNSAFQASQGFTFDTSEIQAQYAKLNGGKADERVLRVFMDNSGETIDWLMDETDGEVPFIGLIGEPPFAHMWEGQQPAIMQVIFDKAVEGGADVHYNTEGVQLVKDGDCVTAVIGKRLDGDKGYVKFVASKGVLLATGDYGNDPDMVDAFAPFCSELANTYMPKVNTGGGHKMGMWIGAALDRPAHAPMIHFDPSPLPEGDAPFSGTPWLAVNKLGVRYQNEDTDYPYIVNQCILQPEHMRFQVVDAAYNEHWDDFGGDFMRWTVSKDNQAEWDAAIKRGAIMQADTLEELAGFMGVPKDAFIDTVKRYNDLVDKGVDEDFGKNPDYLKLTKIETAPFFAIKRVPGVLTILGGLHVNSGLQVLDTDEQPIEGLYAAGNVSGNFFGNDYPLWLGAASCGRAVTFGRYAVKSMLA